MRWRQFFTPVQSFDARQAREYMEARAADAYTLLDVRQPKEYNESHLPGAALIPLPDLGERLQEIDPDKPIIVYCAIGGRSRMAAQMMAGKGFREIYNLSGGIKAWDSNVAVGPVDQGLELFSGRETVEEALIVAYSLEAGLEDFYVSMASRGRFPEVIRLFENLAKIETKHQDHLFGIYQSLAPRPLARSEFEARTQTGMIEGGLTTEAYLERFQPDLSSPVEVISLAMSIEAQALDLYQRTARSCSDPASEHAFLQIANEEKAHLQQLGQLMDRQQGASL